MQIFRMVWRTIYTDVLHKNESPRPLRGGEQHAEDFSFQTALLGGSRIFDRRRSALIRYSLDNKQIFPLRAAFGELAYGLQLTSPFSCGESAA